MRTASEVISVCEIAEKKNASAGIKAKATRFLREYLDQEEESGRVRSQVHAGIKAVMTKRRLAARRSSIAKRAWRTRRVNG